MNSDANQILFDAVVTHLLTQNKKAMAVDGSKCVYRAEDGCKCAIGALIKDEYYNSLIEGSTATSRHVTPLIAKSLGVDLHQINFALLSRLQYIHDDHEVDCWHQSLQNAAADFDLQFNPPVALKP